MRRLHIWVFTAIIGLSLFAHIPATKAQGNYNTVTYQDFYDDLSPYGQWISDAQYGYVWLPDVGPDFRPYYTNGYWANTEYGNTWISDYDWGWAPFHYGRWTYDSYYGWLWIPDTEWAPAWVTWRSNNNYYGWAPMGPGININLNLGLIPMDWWVFLSPNYFYQPNFYQYCNNDYGFRRNIYRQTTIINYTYVDNRTSYYTGPRSNDYYRHTGRRPKTYNITHNPRPGATRVNGNRINIYRPAVNRASNATPGRVASTDRQITHRPQTFSGSAQNAAGRQNVLRQRSVNSGTSPQREGRTRNIAPDQQNVRQQPAQNTQLQQQRDAERQRLLEQRDRQMQDPNQQQNSGRRSTQARELQFQQDRAAQQQRDAQMQQQRVQQQQRDAQMQQQRNMQMQQQQAQQQRDAQMQQQRAQQQQRDAQMQQQRVQQRDVQIQQQRMVEPAQQRSAPVQQNVQAPRQEIQQQRTGERGRR